MESYTEYAGPKEPGPASNDPGLISKTGPHHENTQNFSIHIGIPIHPTDDTPATPAHMAWWRGW